MIIIKIIIQMQTNKKEDFIMLKVIQLFIGQSWELILNIIQWISINISVGWLAFGLAVITFLRNRHRKLRQSFEYSSGNIKIVIIQIFWMVTIFSYDSTFNEPC
ncbi:hypothetical protein Q757_01205 [Oenococcus alcoholitolerans]|uniref:Uncharacterized protein n=1 Tax=Oenococcus alcoholitolerans TaxID=931074 RepID=A0ABR4XTN0_9LACO|nr:hypothetical protein Q757_01205 [Oenococcus alcoholitolerans]